MADDIENEQAMLGNKKEIDRLTGFGIARRTWKGQKREGGGVL